MITGLTVMILGIQTDRSGQTVYTQILKEQSDQDLRYLPSFVLEVYSPVNNEVMLSQSVNSGTVPGQA